VHDLERFELVFNGFYVDDKHIAYVSTGRLPIRAPGVDPGLPTIGTGAYDWKGFLAPDAHPHAIDPASGEIVNWNNKPAPKFDAADDEWSYGPVQRVDLLLRGIKKGKVSPTDLVRAMNVAATQDLRAVEVWPAINAMLAKTLPPDAQAEKLREEVNSWVMNGASRLDRNLDGTVDDPGAGVLDAAWPKLADAVFTPVLGPLTSRLAELETRDDAPGPQGSAYLDGWYGSVEKDMHDVRYCGGGDPVACSKSLWAALDAVGSPPQANAAAERIQFAPGFLPVTMRWANRPTFQQVLSFGSHR
jgi:hypothetical protein